MIPGWIDGWLDGYLDGLMAGWTVLQIDDAGMDVNFLIVFPEHISQVTT